LRRRSLFAKNLTFIVKDKKIKLKDLGVVLAKNIGIRSDEDWLLEKMKTCYPGFDVFKKYRSWLERMDRLSGNPPERRTPRGGHTQEEWEELKSQYNYTCPCCGRAEPEITLTRDHVVPRSMRWNGASNLDDIENIQPLCSSCNRKKGDRSIPRYPHPSNGNNIAMHR